ncbi:7997_t:CDS:2 [Scutellospora calospora]|uniref:7997_t:CDS:1 n=1 Tax=Scutellospora calospora TaxID=85575 RepID=A0ACA9K4V4_9GLOM|nr:7997_t:CDS:2 [Scutellospora calospora]
MVIIAKYEIDNKDTNSYTDEADFAAGYYEALTFVAIIIVISIVYQFKQIQRYFSHSKLPSLPDLPQRRNKYEQDIYTHGNSQSTVNLASKDNIHFSPTVYAYKLWNYVIHIFGIGDMTIVPSTLNIRAAYVGLGNAAFIYPLATRNSVFLKLIGVPFERMIRFHRWVGRTIFFLLSFHASYQLQLAGSLNSVFSSPILLYAGQYMFINIPSLSPPVSLIAWHPVSFSSAPGIEEANNDSIHMKIQGSFTRRLYAKSQEGGYDMGLKMKVDGPYGKPSLNFAQYRTVVLVSGGIGITPMISILRDLVDRQTSKMPITTQSIYFIWTVPDTNTYSCFGNELNEITEKFNRLPKSKYLLDIKVFLTRSTTTPSSVFFQGRPDVSMLFQEIKQYHGSGDIAVGVCGPASMLKEVRKAAIVESDRTCLIKVHCETFEL